MKTAKILFFYLLATWACMPLAAEEAPKEFSLEFGILQFNQDGTIKVKEKTNVIPFCPIRRSHEIVLYGIQVKEKNKQVFTGKMVHHYPGPATSWLPFDDPEAKNKKITAISQFAPERTTEGWWAMIETMHEGDPLGKHRLEVYLDDKLFQEVTFEVVKATSCPTMKRR